VRRHVESDNLVILAVLLEFERFVALMAVNNKQLMRANNSSLCMLIKVLQLLQAELICCLAVLRNSNNLIVRRAALLILSREVVLALEDNEGWDCLTYRVDALDHRCLLSITLLYRLWPSSALRSSDYCSS
jgi:hypothetical protein